MSRIQILKQRLMEGEKILLAGACGTEIQRRGVKTELPLWSASALLTHPEIVQKIHKDYIEAGAEIITTNTFRTNRRTLQKAGLDDKISELTRFAFSLADKARKDSQRNDVLIGGSLAPVEDCYTPGLIPSKEHLKNEHAEQSQYLAEAGVDFIFIETMNSIEEATIALEAAKKTGLEVAVSFVCNDVGNLLSGESIEKAFNRILPFGPFAVLTNCSSPTTIGVSLKRLLKASDGVIPIGVYGNGDGQPDNELGWKFTENMDAGKYLLHARKWLQDGASIIGGCCGTNPNYIKLIKRFLNSLGRPYSAKT